MLNSFGTKAYKAKFQMAAEKQNLDAILEDGDKFSEITRFLKS